MARTPRRRRCQELKPTLQTRRGPVLGPDPCLRQRIVVRYYNQESVCYSSTRGCFGRYFSYGGSMVSTAFISSAGKGWHFCYAPPRPRPHIPPHSLPWYLAFTLVPTSVECQLPGSPNGLLSSRPAHHHRRHPAQFGFGFGFRFGFGAGGCPKWPLVRVLPRTVLGTIGLSVLLLATVIFHLGLGLGLGFGL